MAKKYNEVYSSVYTTGNKMGWGNALLRNNGVPLDMTEIYDSLNKAIIYAATDPTAYEGQLLAVTENNDTTVYVISPQSLGEVTIDQKQYNNYLKEVGTATLGDGKSVVLDSDSKTLSLNGFGKEYYAYNSVTNTWNEDPSLWNESISNNVFPDVKLVDNEPILIWKEYAIKQNKIVDEFKTIKDDLGKKANSEDVDNRISQLGTVLRYAGTLTATEFANKSATDYTEGDVVLVLTENTDGNNICIEYVVVNKDNVLTFEKFSDPNGGELLKKTVEDIRLEVEGKKLDGTTDAEALKTAIITKLDANKINTLSKGTGWTGTIAKSTEEGATDKDLMINITSVDSATNATNATEANHTVGTFTVLGTQFNGSENKTITVQDIHNKVGAATSSDFGFVKSQTKSSTEDENLNKVFVGTDGTMNIVKASNAKKADEATKLTNAITILGETYDGSQQNVEITADEVKTAIGIATDTTTGLVKGAELSDSDISNLDKVFVDNYGLMTVKKVTSAMNADRSNSADKVAKTLYFKDKATGKSFDGSAETVVTLTDLGFDGNNYVANDTDYATVKSNANSAMQDVTIAGKQLDKTTKTLTADEIYTAMGLGDMSKENKADYVAKTTYDAFVGKQFAYTDADNTFTKKVIVPDLTDESADGEAANKKYVNAQISAHASAVDAMRFCGLLGGEGNFESLPTSDVKNGDTYKVAVAGQYNGAEDAKPGDMYIALVSKGENGSVTISWQLIPSANENDGNVSASGTLKNNTLIVGADGKNVKSLAPGQSGQLLFLNYKNEPEWMFANPQWGVDTKTGIETTDTIEAVEATDNVNHLIKYQLNVKKVSTDVLSQGEQVLVFDCGNSTF